MYLPTLIPFLGALLLSSCQGLALPSEPTSVEATSGNSYNGNQNATISRRATSTPYLDGCNPDSCKLVNTWELQCSCNSQPSGKPGRIHANFVKSRLKLGWCLKNRRGNLIFEDTYVN